MLKLNFLVPFAILISIFCTTKNVYGQATTASKKIQNQQPKRNTKTLFGQASFYSAKFEGRKTASGQMFNHRKFTAACNSLPLGTFINVTNLKNGKTVIVQTNDRLNKKTKRLIDLTMAGAKRLGYVKAGLTRVKVEVLANKSGN